MHADSNIEDMIVEMEPWYDNHCFAGEGLRSDVRVFNCDMALYYFRHYIDFWHSPEKMLDPNTKTDYNKLKKLLQLYSIGGERKGVNQTIAEKSFTAMPQHREMRLCVRARV